MKTIKKLALVPIITATTLVVIACSQSDQQNNQQAITQKQEQKQETKLSKEEVLKKSLEAFNNLKSFQEDETGESYDQAIEPGTQIKAYKRSFSADITNLNYKEEADNMVFYKIDNQQYSQIKGQPWRKTSVKIGTEGQKELILRSPITSISKYNKDYIVNETDTTYEIVFKPTDLKEYALIYYSNRPEAIRTNYSLEQFTMKIILSKSTFLPISSDVEYKGAISYSGEKANFYYKTSTKYSNYNSLPTIQLPEEAKNAKEMSW